MKGYKTWIAAIGAWATGIAMLAKALSTSPVDMTSVYQAILVIWGGFGLVGIAHKIEKLGNNKK